MNAPGASEAATGAVTGRTSEAATGVASEAATGAVTGAVSEAVTGVAAEAAGVMR